MSRFLISSLLIAALAGAAVINVLSRVLPDASLSGMTRGAVAAVVVSTAGWLLVLMGIKGSPSQAIRAFGAGTLLKFVGTGVVALLARFADWGPMRDVLLSYITVFCLLGLAQLVMVIRSAAPKRS